MKYFDQQQIHPKAREYLNSRGITDEVIEKYHLGGDDRKVSIPIKGFNKYRTYPEKNYFYDRGFSACLFGAAQLEGSKWCVLTEGELDALRLASENIPAVSGTGGAATFKDEWIMELPELVFICYDTDKAGKDNAEKLNNRIANSYLVTLPEGKDVTEYLQNHTRSDFIALLRKAIYKWNMKDELELRAKILKDIPYFHKLYAKYHNPQSLETARNLGEYASTLKRRMNT